MKKIFAIIINCILFLGFTISLHAQCTGGRYHDMVFPGNPTVVSDVVYGSNKDYQNNTVQLKLDVYKPACDTATKRPLVVFAHGGSFMTGDKADAGYAATAVALAQLGYVVASINYRLGFETSLPGAQWGFNSAIMRGVHDGRAAVRYLKANAATYGIDSSKVYFGGVSAGGIIALHLAYQNLAGEHNMSCNSQYGSDCSSIEGNSNSLTTSSKVKGIISISGGIRDTSWITTNDIPVCMAHGTVDGTVPYGSGTFGGFFPVHGSSSIAKRCNTTSTKYCFKPMINQDHVPTNTAYTDTLVVLMRNFLESFACNSTLNCNYTTTPTTLSPGISIAVTSGTNPTCGSNPLTFTATATNAGPNYSYQWKKNGTNVGTGVTYTLSTPANNDVITCVLTSCSSANPVTSNAITVQVGSVTPSVAIAITSGSNPTCGSNAITFTATPTNGGNAPTYQWKKNGSNIATGITYNLAAPANGDLITCEMTSNASCANPVNVTSNSITVSVSSSVAPAVTIAVTSGSNPTCGSNAITFTATPTNGGNAPTYQWKKNGSNIATGVTYNLAAPANGDVITCVITSNSSCANPATATSNSITVTVNTPPTISKSGNVLTSSASAGNQWYLNGQIIQGATGQTHTATVSGNYTVVAGGNGCASLPNNVIISGILEAEKNIHQLNVYPNPASGDFNISFNAAKPKTFKVQMNNLAGESVYEETLVNFSGAFQKQLDVSEFSKGVYVLKLSDGEGDTSVQVVVY